MVGDVDSYRGIQSWPFVSRSRPQTERPEGRTTNPTPRTLILPLVRPSARGKIIWHEVPLRSVSHPHSRSGRTTRSRYSGEHGAAAATAASSSRSCILGSGDHPRRECGGGAPASATFHSRAWNSTGGHYGYRNSRIGSDAVQLRINWELCPSSQQFNQLAHRFSNYCSDNLQKKDEPFRWTRRIIYLAEDPCWSGRVTLRGAHSCRRMHTKR